MQPELSLDLETVARNARAWREFAGVELYAVVKAQGYGWGTAPLVRALENIADAYCVADAEELNELRRHTQKRAVVLSAIEPDRLAEVLRANAQPTIGSPAELEIVRRVLADMRAPLHVRVGVRPAAAWSGISLDELRDFAPALAACGAQVQFWTHITDFARRSEQARTFREALRLAREAGVRLSGTDIAGTFSLAADGAQGSAVRVGVGLFGATGGLPVPGVRCALRLRAPLVRLERHSPGTRVGYGGTMLRMGETIATARCGYADGLPKDLAGADDILSVGMQYVTVRASRLDGSNSRLVLLDESGDLDAFAAAGGRTAHEIVTALGNCARANGVSLEP